MTLNEVFDTITLWWATADVLGGILTAAVILIPLAIGAWALLFASEKAIAQARQVYRTIVRPQIDEPTDYLVLYISRKTGMAPEEVVEYLLSNLDTVFPEALRVAGSARK